MKKRLVVFGIIAVVACLGLLLLFKGQEFTITLTEEDIQAAIDKKMPYKKGFALVCTLKVDKTAVELNDSADRIIASTDVIINIANAQQYKGYVKTETAIRYDAEQFRFYLLDPSIEKLHIEGIPRQYTNKVTEKSKEFLSDYLLDVPIYTIKDKNLKMKLAKAVLKDVRVRYGKLEITLAY